MAVRGPMLARAVEQLPTPGECAGGCLYEPKWDGWRCWITVDEDGRARLTSRHGTVLTTAFPEVAGAAARLLPPRTIVDGELIRWRPAGILDFPALQRRAGGGRRAAELARTEPCDLIAFDVLEAAGENFRPELLHRRRARLEELFAAIPDDARLKITWQTADLDEALVWLDTLPRYGVEGLLIKAADGRYQPGVRGWWKYKPRKATTMIVGGVTGTLDRPTGLILGRIDSRTGRLRAAGRVSALSEPAAADLAPLLIPAGPDHPWPVPLPASWAGGLPGQDAIEYHQVQPTLVVEVLADVAVQHGAWRHPLRYVRPRPDLTGPEVPTDLNLD